jgi:peptidoglycan/xylan/chitin deacetylase (PgdA/CDA1 family)
VKRPLVAAAAIVGLVLLAGCAPERDDTWVPPAWTADVTLTTAPSPLDAARVPNLVGERIRNDAMGLHARWMRFPGDGPLNARLSGLVRDAIAARTGETGVGYVPTVFPRGAGLGDRACARGSTLLPAEELLADAALGPGPTGGTAVVCDIVAAAGPFFGERLRVVTGSAAGVASDTSTVLYADTASGQVATAAELWTDAAAPALWSDIIEAVRRAHGALSLAAVQPPDDAALARIHAALAQTVPGEGGSLVITLSAGLTSPELAALGMPATTEPVTIAVPPSASVPILSSFGAALVAAASEPFQAPAPVAAGFEPVDCALFPCVAVTYDDGPSAWTPGILDEAAAHRVAVTFFAMGQKADGNAEVMRRAIEEGHLVENHTWNHPHLPTLTRAQVLAQVRDTTAAIGAADGHPPTVFRPPYGEYDAAVVEAAGMAAILWDVDTFDWQGASDDVVVQRAVDEPHPGSIILQHDIQPNTARTVGAVYDGLHDRGFTLVNVEQLFGGHLPVAGVWRARP